MTQIKLLEMKNTLDGINTMVGTAEEEIGKFNDIATETVQNETHTQRKILKKKNKRNSK